MGGVRLSMFAIIGKHYFDLSEEDFLNSFTDEQKKTFFRHEFVEDSNEELKKIYAANAPKKVEYKKKKAAPQEPIEEQVETVTE